MKLSDIINRNMELQPWEEGEKIPWNDPAFSRRMLKEHLTQKHDAASRRTSKIKKQVDWIHRFVLEERPSRILDLGCGPGLYTSRLAALRHICRGIDFSPASIEYATKHAHPGCSYTLADVRTADYGGGYDLVMFIYGELNVFRFADARTILQKARAALNPGSRLLLEISTFDAVEQIGNQPATWYSSPKGLFADTPHLCLMESFWDESQSVATERYLIVDTATGEVSRYAASSQAYEDNAIELLLNEVGFRDVSFHPSLTGKEESGVDDFMVIVARK
jgi:SAM-dependent methyltransferase